VPVLFVPNDGDSIDLVPLYAPDEVIRVACSPTV